MIDRYKLLVCLLVATMGIHLSATGPSALAQDHAVAAVAMPPAIELTPKALPLQKDEGDPATRPHQLKGVRLQPLPKAMRLILMFDRPTAYALRQDIEYQRIYLDLINTNVGFLSADLHRIDDSRLNGVWLKRIEQGLTTLELRLSSPNVRIDHFAMDDPPAIVLDLYRTDQDWASIAQTTPRTLTIESTDGPLTPTTPRPKPIVPLDQLAQIDNQPTHQLAQATPVPEPSPTPTDAPQADEDPAIDPPEEAGPSEAPQVVSNKHDGSEIKPLSAEYDFFPIDAVHLTSPLAEEIMDDFLYRRWGSVLSQGLQYLKLNTVNEESAYILYLMAEARWQLTSDETKPEVIHDLENFYRQALAVFDQGDLASFAHWRLAQTSMKTRDLDGAIAHAQKAVESNNKNVQLRSLTLKTKILILQKRLDEALELLAGLKTHLETPRHQLTAALLTGQVQAQLGNYDLAWESYVEADKLFPDWPMNDDDQAENKAKTAYRLGKYQLARDILEDININFYRRDENKRVRAGLLYIEVLAELGQVRKAESRYYDIFHNLEETEKGRKIMEKLYRLYPEDLIEGQGHYCLLLMRQGKIRKAMKELDRAYNQCLKEGVSTQGLDPAISLVVPAYLKHAQEMGHHYDIAQIWWLYGRLIEDQDVRLQCQAILAQSHEKLGLYEDALRLTQQLCASLPSPNLPSPVQMHLRESRLLLKNDQTNEAIERLEALVNQTNDWPVLQETYGLLAKAYAETGRDLEAAQAWQTLSQTPDLAPELLGEALVQAGEIFLDNQMTTQTLELGLKGLIYENQLIVKAQDNPEKAATQTAKGPWESDAGRQLRRLLGQTYFERGDYERSIIVLKDLLNQPGLQDDERCKVMLQVARDHRQLGQAEEAFDLYAQLAENEDTPQIWRQIAKQWRDNIRWDLNNPYWMINSEDASPLTP